MFEMTTMKGFKQWAITNILAWMNMKDTCSLYGEEKIAPDIENNWPICFNTISGIQTKQRCKASLFSYWNPEKISETWSKM